MVRRWILYLVVLLGSIGFYIANQQWLGWLLLILVLTIPITERALRKNFDEYGMKKEQ